MKTVGDLLAAHPFFEGLDGEIVGELVSCASNVHVHAGEYLFREGEPADRFFVVRKGRVALDVHAPGRGPVVVATVEPGDVVGWSWFVPPYRWFFDARAVTAVSAVAVDAACLRDKCDTDPALGYALMQRIARVMYQRLQATRVRLLDVYGSGQGG